MDNIPEHENSTQIDKEILIDQFDKWRDVLKESGWKSSKHPSKQAEAAFLIGRYNDEEAIVSNEEVYIFDPAYSDSVGRQIPSDELPNKREEGNWIGVNIRPKDSYRSKIKSFDNNYYIESLVVYVSSKGEALEKTYWALILPPERENFNSPTIKQITSEIIRVDKEPNLEEVEALKSLRGQTLERLKYLLQMYEMHKVKVLP